MPAPRWACGSTPVTGSPIVTVRTVLGEDWRRTTGSSREGGSRDGRCARGVHVHRRDAGRGGRSRRASRRRCARPRRRRPRRCRGGRSAAGAEHRSVAADPRRPPARRPRAARHDRAQPALEHEQRRRVRPAEPVRATRWRSEPTASAPTWWPSSSWRSSLPVPATSPPAPTRRGDGWSTGGRCFPRRSTTASRGRTRR